MSCLLVLDRVFQYQLFKDTHGEFWTVDSLNRSYTVIFDILCSLKQNPSLKDRERDEGDDTLYSCLALETQFMFYVEHNLDNAIHS